MTREQQRQARIDDFFTRNGTALARQGSVVASWRWKDGRRLGPFFRLDVRDERGRKAALYLGRESPLVADVRARLAQLQRRRRQRQQFARNYRIRRLDLRAAHQNLADELQKVGLRLQGSEVRGLAARKLAARKHVLAETASPENTEQDNGSQ